MHYYIIAGETSGDLYGSNVIKSIKNIDLSSKFTALGGEHIEYAGGDVVRRLDKLAFMGFSEVVKNIFTIVRNFHFVKQSIKEANPDAIILIDYPAFNLKIAKYAKQLNIPVFWLVPPKVWAWNPNRIFKLKQYVDTLFVIFPFELDLFVKEKIKSFYFGNPLIDILNNQINKPFTKPLGKAIIALLPGSRKQEIVRMLPMMLSASLNFPEYRFVIICATNISRSFYEPFVKQYKLVDLVYEKGILNSVTAAIVTSGTATLELAILNIPQIVCYKLNYISFFLAKIFVNIQFISLVNILAKKQVVPELIQGNCTVHSMTYNLNTILINKERKKMLSDYNDVTKTLGPSGCFDKIADSIYKDLLGIKMAAIK